MSHAIRRKKCIRQEEERSDVRINNQQKRPALTKMPFPYFRISTTTTNNLYLKDNLLDPSFLLMMLVKPILSVQMTPVTHVTSLAIFTCLVCFLGHGAPCVELLLRDCLG